MELMSNRDFRHRARSPITTSPFQQEIAMFRQTACALAALTLAAAVPAEPLVAATPSAAPSAAGVLRLRSDNGFDDTLARLKADVQAKGIRYFDTIDQAALGASADLDLRRSTLVLFGNPPLGVQFLQSNPYSGLDWPVRMLVIESADGAVYVAWTDFAFIAERYAIDDRGPQFAMASEVAASIATAATSR
jgi:uncharacterized protein (DUF302 family)